MRKDSKRALLLWPATASLAVVVTTALPWFWAQKQPNETLWDGLSRQLPWNASLASKPPEPKTGTNDQSDPHGFGAAEPLVSHGDIIWKDRIRTQPPLTSPVFQAPIDRPDRGSRGLAKPSRLDDTVVQSRPASPMDVALFAPVVDPDTELAGFADDTKTDLLDESSDAEWDASIDPEMQPIASLAPLSLAPGIDDPAEMDAIVGQTESVALPAEMFRTRLPDAKSPADRPNGSLIPESVEVLAKTSVEVELPRLARPPVAPSSMTPSATLTNHANGWPLPKQLRLELATLSSHAALAKASDQALNEQLLTSVDLNNEDFESAHDQLMRSGNAMSVPETSTARLQRHATSIVMGRWADQVDQRLTQLRELPRLGDPNAGTILRELASLARAGLQLAERAPARDQQVRWLQTSHSLARRTSVWSAIWQLTHDNPEQMTPNADPNDLETLTASEASNFSTTNPNATNPSATNPNAMGPNAIGPDVATLTRRIREMLPQTGDLNGWNKFMMLDKIEAIAESDNIDDRALTAQRYLSRITSDRIDFGRNEWLQDTAVTQLTSAMKTWSAVPIDYVTLLKDLERAEADAIDLAAVEVTDAYQSLRFSDDPAAARIAKAIDLNYRNANVRTAISANLIRRLIPSVPARTSPIQTQIKGTPVRGTSHVAATMDLRLQPAKNVWNIELLTNGNVATQSQAAQSGVTVHSNGWAQFTAATPVRITASGLSVGGTDVDISSDNQLRDIDSKLAGWPLIGSLIEGIAEKKFQESKGIANQKTQQQIRGEVITQTQSELNAKTYVAEQKWDDLVLGPLGRLELDPTVIDLETTSERLIARYRLAGDWQLAANTPRPRAWNDSWLSFQMHQSALNNTLEQILPRGETKTFAELFASTAALFGQEDAALPEDVPGEAEIAFATTRPITIEIEDGKLWLTMRVISLSQPGSKKLRRFIVRAAYVPQVDGLKATLVRDGHLRISGPGMSMGQRLPIRAVFNTVLAEERVIPLTMPRLHDHPAARDLIVSQLELRDGWLALAVSPAGNSPRMAVRPGR